MRKLMLFCLLAVATVTASGCFGGGRPGIFSRNQYNHECCCDPCGGATLMAPPVMGGGCGCN
jgi:hypothetical protein